MARFLRCSDLLTRFEGLANRRFRVEMIAGIYLVERPEDILSIDDMLDRANLAQKSVKHLSGSKYALYSEEMRKRVLYEKNIESCMEEALRNREFCLHLQPQVDIQHGDALFGAEVLVRWERPGYGMVSPGDFIPLFERNGFIVDLDAFVFEEACAYLASRGSRGLPPLRLSVNVSRLSIAQGDFLDRYSAIRDKYGIDSGMLELECTETMVIRNFALFRELMAALPSRGFRSAMDDFGTGYSSLNMLKEIALDVLKLDIAFFRDTEGTPRERAVVESIVQMARALGMSTVAEGVEKQEQVEFLRSIGCSAIQGYIFSRPVPLALFESVEASFPLYVEG
ncbi:putative bifunctional diguanylate cyclase/phosphodiesterase [Bilophila wadsworthia]